MKKILWSVLGLGAVMVGAQVACMAAPTDSQTFTVNVPKRVSIAAPLVAPLPETLPLDQDTNVVFPNQLWSVKGNVKNGVAVTFKTTTVFTNGTYKRDVTLNLSAAVSPVGPGTWTVGAATDTTNYAATVSDEEAIVSASSNKVGSAGFNLGVEFVTSDFDQVAEGDYVTIVTGTVTENL